MKCISWSCPWQVAHSIDAPPFAFGPLRAGERQSWLFALPGNPVAALVCGRLFLAPLLARMQGLDSAGATEAFPACVDSLLPSGDGRETYLRGALFMRNGKVLVRASAGQDSANLSSFAASNILIARAPYSSPAAAGDLVRCLSWLPR